MKKGKQAFTIIELSMALSITAILALVTFQFMDSLISVWHQTDKSISIESESRLALNQIEEDLEAAFFAEGNGAMLAVDALFNDGNSGRWDPPGKNARPGTNSFDPTIHRYGWAGSWLRFFTADPSLNAVGYQVVRSPQMTDATDAGYHLFRGSVRGDHTVAEGLDITAGEYGDNTEAQILSNPVEVIAPRKENIIASNVVDFGVRLYVYEKGADFDGVPEGMRLIFPADTSGNLVDTDVEHHATTSLSSTPSELYPDAVEVYLRILDKDGAGLIYDLEEYGSSNAEWNQIVADHSRLYSRFIKIKGSAL